MIITIMMLMMMPNKVKLKQSNHGICMYRRNKDDAN